MARAVAEGMVAVVVGIWAEDLPGIWAEDLPEGLPEAAVSAEVLLSLVLTMAESMAVTTGMVVTTGMGMAGMAAADGAGALLYISAGPGMVRRGPTTTGTTTRPLIPFILPHRTTTRPLIPFILPDPRQRAAGIAATIRKAITLMFRRAISPGKPSLCPLSIMPTTAGCMDVGSFESCGQRCLMDSRPKRGHLLVMVWNHEVREARRRPPASE